MVSKRFILKRLLLLAPVLFGVATLVFAILQLAPGDPARVIVGQRASAEQIAQVRADLGLNDPLWVQYGRFLFDAAQFEFGQSYKVAQGRAVRDVLADRLPVTIELALYGQLLGILLGIPLGVLSAIRQDSFTDHATRVGALTGISVPIFWSGPLLILLFSTYLGLLPASGRIGSAFFLSESWTLFGTELPLTGMVTIDTLLLGRFDAWTSAVQHLFMPAAVIGIQFGTLLGGAVLTETIFGIGGIGVTIVDAIGASDYTLVQGTVLTFALLFTLVNLGVDITYSYLDPRIDQ